MVFDDLRLKKKFRDAVNANNLRAIQEYLEDGFEPNTDLSYGLGIGLVDPYNQGYRALHFAARSGHIELIKLLHSKGADLNIGNVIKNTPLHVAIYNKQEQAVETLLALGADVNKLNDSSAVRTDTHAETPLHYAVEYAPLSIVKLVIKYRANLSAKDGNNKTPLEWVKDKLDSEITDEERERLESIQTYFEEFSKKRIQDEEKDVLKKWEEWFQRDTLFQKSYESRIRHDYLNYTTYNTLYMDLKDVYQYMLSEEYLTKKQLFIAELKQKDSYISQTMNKLMQAANHNAKEISAHKKLRDFYQKLYEVNDDESSELLKKEAACIFSTREKIEHVFRLNQKGIEAKLMELKNTLDNLQYANTVLTEHKNFFEEAHKRIDDVLNFPEKADFYKRIYMKNKDKIIQLRANSTTLSLTRKNENNRALSPTNINHPFSSPFFISSESPCIQQPTFFSRKSLDNPRPKNEETDKEFEKILNNFN